MSAEIQHLINTWAAGPSRVEPDDDEHLFYIFAKLLPALNAAMPAITSLIQSQEADFLSPNSAASPAPSAAPSSHIPTEIPKTAGNAEASGHTEGTSYISASSPATVGDMSLESSMRRAEGRATPKQTRKRAAAPPSERHGTA